MAEQTEFLGSLSPEERAALEYSWQFLGRKNQFAPPGDWRNWLVLAGRGFGKTRTGAEWVRSLMCGATPLTGGKHSHIAIIAETAKDARDVMVGDGRIEGSGILQVHPKDFRPLYEPSKRRLTWPNGCVASIYNGSEPDQLRGPEHGAAWCDEIAKWAFAQDAWDQLQFTLRNGVSPQVLISTTPRPIKLLKSIIKNPGTVLTVASTLENASNLAPQFLTEIQRQYAGTRLGRQEIDAQMLDDDPGAMWSRELIDRARIQHENLPQLKRVVVAIDPSTTSGENADETGIIAAGVDHRDHAYILADESGVMAPNEWARKAIRLYDKFGADKIIGETNNGGDMIENTIRALAPNISYRGVHASRGKVLRAEPVAMLYEREPGLVHHVGAFQKLEDQMCLFNVDYDRSKSGSPDRLDALVWALTELMIGSGAPQLFFG